ncbi:fdxN element excision recombinase XisF [Cyanobacterium aponinum AL20118]|uniref:FdxN element excision recombinase XisF n=1 Tax=Cyanobacterium aponinum AL20115 TaxID=3090662 RepID=A0AAF0ZC48_9CHRO|nr:fdxN element excision recombinase XisF [Cyanobacterium aponinum]WPF87500.1 fdxN element excision recombinase XisF [Cyanobacterium aponinum AL20115]
MRIGYCRVSTREQSEKSNALEQQRQRIEREGVERIIVDVESGYKDKEREGLQSLICLIKQGIVNEVIITRLDRLGRSVLELNKIVKQMEEYNCTLRALDDKIDMSTVDGRLHFNILASFAQSESDRLSEKIKHGFQHRRDNKLMMFKPSFGYALKNGKYVLDHKPYLCTIKDRQEYSKYKISQRIIDTYLKCKSVGKTLTLILEYYGVGMLSYQGLRAWLQNPVLDGHTVYKITGEIHYNTHEPIISPSVRQEINLTFNQSKHTRRHSGGTIYPFSGKVYCAYCGASCNILNNAPSKYYRCRGKINKKIKCTNSKYTRLEKIDKVFIGELIKHSGDILTLISKENTKRETPELLKLRSQREALLAIPSNPAIDKAIREIESQIRKLESATYSKIHNKKLEAVLSSPLFWETLNPSDKKNIVWLLVDKILILDGNVQEIRFKREYTNARI